MVSPPTALSDTLTAQGWGQGPLEYPIPGPSYLTQPAPSRATWGEEALRPQGGPPWVPPPPSQIWPGRPDLERPGFRPGGEFWPGQGPARIDFPPAQEEIGGATAYQPPDIVIPPSVREVSPGPLIPSPAPAPEPYPRREPIARVPILGPETAPVTRMVPVTRPGRELLDVIAENPQMLAVLKAYPGLLQLIAQERERQEWEDVLPTAGPAAPSAAAPAGVTAPAPPAAPREGAPTEGAIPPSAAPEVTALKTRLEPSIAKMVRKPQLLGTPRGKALMEDYLKLEEAEGKAEERAGKAQERKLKAATAEEEQDFREWALAQAQARVDAGDQPGAEEYILMSRNPQLGVQIMKDRREREQETAEQKFFTGLAEKEPDPDRKRLFEIAAVSKGVRAEAIKALKPEEKALTGDVLTVIGRTGMDPRTGKPAPPDLAQQGKAYIEGGVQAGERVARAQAEGRAGVALQQPIGDDAIKYADEKGQRPSPDTPKSQVYANYINITGEQLKFLQAYDGFSQLLTPERIESFKLLFPYEDYVRNVAYRELLRKGYNPRGLNAEDLKQARTAIAQFAQYNRQATQAARLTGETGNVATADTNRVMADIPDAANFDIFKAALDDLRTYMNRGRAFILTHKGKQQLPTGLAPPLPSEKGNDPLGIR
jgi:hypothetical protein